MNLLNPWALVGLISLPVIVWLHTHLERNRRVLVSSIFLWAFLDEKFQGQKPKFIRLSWLLILDLLIAFFLTAALARPVIDLPTLRGAAVQQVILLDTSASMLAEDAESSRFSQAKGLAVELIEGARSQDQSLVVTFGGESEIVGNSLRDGRPSLVNAVSRLTPLGKGNSLREGLSLALSAASPELPQIVYIITDGAFPEPDLTDVEAEFKYVFVGTDQNNQALISPELTHGDDWILFFRVANYSVEGVTRTVEVYADEVLVSQRSLSLAPREVRPVEVRVPDNSKRLEARIVEIDQLPVDNQLYLGSGLQPEVNVLIVADDPFPIDRAVEVIVGENNIDTVSPSAYSSDLGNDLVIFRGYLPDGFPKTTSIFFDAHLNNQNDELPFAIGDQIYVAENKPITIGADFLRGLDLGGVRWGNATEIESQENNLTPLVRAGSTSLLLLYSEPETNVLVFTPTLADGNFTKHPSFPIFLSKVVDFARSKTPDGAYYAGDLLELEDKTGRIQYTLKAPGAEGYSSIPDGGLPLNETGHYSLTLSDQNRIERVLDFGVSMGSLEESDTQPGSWRQNYLQGEESTSETGIGTLEVDLSPWLLFAAVALLFMEAWRAWR